MRALNRLEPRHREALDQAVAYVSEHYEPWAVLVAGTLLRGEGDPRSDLDLYVLHDADFRQRVQRWFNDVAVEIFVNPETSVLGYLNSEAKSGRLFTAHMLSTGVPLVVRDGKRLELLVEKASAALSRPPAWDDASLVRARYAAATLVEDALDCWERDRVAAHHLLSKGIDSCLAYWYMSHGRNIPRNKEVATEVASNDPDLGELLTRFFRSIDEEDRWESGLGVADRVLGTRGFFEWESEREAV